MKQISGCEEWLLKNGGECWVEVVREKTKRKETRLKNCGKQTTLKRLFT